ncbi:diacylglycerol/lipid kinase family protein [Pontibacter silvestris]|uniref:Diacylglycerol/lipid kinase family protein n=1 Tax=Pontibacter silvestris TaxID=2305183 RepID=A0ABW4WVZ4_9BACT|nr:diacylglycerol kinase family protein [Pontibacter silvestris]MCC9138362.1 diacylglycerol kinase family lipid kinase [Pontibacter silvestris]
MSHQSTIRFIINPTSGPKSRQDVAALIALHLDKNKYRHEIVYTAHAGHATDLAKEAADKGCNIVVAVGGDGTVNEVARGLLYSETALAILPKGSGNGLARHLLVPLNIKGALRIINRGYTSFIDSGNINGHPFFTTAGIGFDAYISSVFAGNSKRGLKTYVQLVLKEVMKYRHLPIKATINGSVFDSDCYVMAFANAAQYGNNAYIAPMANIQDGMLDVCLVRQLNFRKALHLSYCMLTKQLATDSAEYFQTNAVEVETEQEIMYHADGDFMGKASRFSVHMEPKSLKVVVPA